MNRNVFKVRNGRLLGWRERVGAWNSGKQFHVLIESAMDNWIRVHVLSCSCLLYTSDAADE